MRYFLERDLDRDLERERPEKRDFFGGWRGVVFTGRCRERVWRFGNACCLASRRDVMA